MSEESVKRSTKKHRTSEREEKSKSKNDKKSSTEKNSYDISDSRQCSDPSIAKLASKKDSTLTLTTEDPLSGTSPSTSSNRTIKKKVSKKRKRTTDHEAMPEESAECDTEPEDRKRSRHQGKYLIDCPDPAVDESLSEQSRRALSYVYERYRELEVWKFNKARQNWLLRNVWLEQAVPEGYMPLVIKYLLDIKGGARQKLIEECNLRVSASVEEAGHIQPSDHITGSKINEQPNASRALSILSALGTS